MLERLGYRADVALSGCEVIEAVHRQHYDVVLMDMQMPEMDGLEATRRVRTDFPDERQPYIIALAANAVSGDRDRCLDAGMNDYLSKPVKLDALGEALARSRTATEEPTASDLPPVTRAYRPTPAAPLPQRSVP